MADKQAIMMALKEAMAGGGGAPATSKRPMARPNGLGESGRTISDADREMLKNMIGGMPGGSTRGIDPKENYSEEDLMRLLMSAGAKSPKKPAGMMRGGKVQGYNDGGAVGKKKPKMGCVMKGRGGKYKGMK